MPQIANSTNFLSPLSYLWAHKVSVYGVELHGILFTKSNVCMIAKLLKNTKFKEQ
jgi:hypothetical protein